MYKLDSIKDYEMTRDLNLINLKTNTLDICFDDSEVTSFDNFSFMKVGETYDCKIYLFGEQKFEGLEFKYIRDVIVGDRTLVEVSNDLEDIYFVEKNKIETLKVGETFNFNYTRKDIIQVNDKIHPDFIIKN